jgi:hypothetical protein
MVSSISSSLVTAADVSASGISAYIDIFSLVIPITSVLVVEAASPAPVAMSSFVPDSEVIPIVDVPSLGAGPVLVSNDAVVPAIAVSNSSLEPCLLSLPDSGALTAGETDLPSLATADWGVSEAFDWFTDFVAS